MDDVAVRAHVSKQTVYSHFADKERLFTELIATDIADSETSTHPLIESMLITGHLERDLRVFARAPSRRRHAAGAAAHARSSTGWCCRSRSMLPCRSPATMLSSPPRELNHYADEGVRVFLAAYAGT